MDIEIVDGVLTRILQEFHPLYLIADKRIEKMRDIINISLSAAEAKGRKEVYNKLSVNSMPFCIKSSVKIKRYVIAGSQKDIDKYKPNDEEWFLIKNIVDEEWFLIKNIVNEEIWLIPGWTESNQAKESLKECITNNLKVKEWK